MHDPTETFRRQMVEDINIVPGSREDLESQYGQVWDTKEMSEDFVAIGFMAPYIMVFRKSDGVKGTLMFQHNPRWYFRFQAD